jgi:hypothetical protein
MSNNPFLLPDFYKKIFANAMFQNACWSRREENPPFDAQSFSPERTIQDNEVPGVLNIFLFILDDTNLSHNLKQFLSFFQIKLIYLYVAFSRKKQPVLNSISPKRLIEKSV